jgi:predicted phage terminase large subunit-like protein
MQNTKEDRQLLYKYLKKLYNSEKAREIMQKHKDNLFGKNGLAYAVGKRSIEFFCLYFLQDTFRVKENNDARPLAPFHYEIWNTLEIMILKDEFDKLVLCLPRGHAKSTVVTYATVIWLHCYGKSFYTIVQGKTERDAQKFIFDVRSAFENNEYIKKTFGELIDTKNFTVNANELHLTNNTKIEAISSTSSMRGRKHLGKRPQYIICDDIAGLDDVITDQAKQKKIETFKKDVLYAGDTPVFRDGKKIKSGSKYIILGTVLAEGDFISSLIADKTYNHILKRGIPLENFDVDGYFNNNPYWAEFKRIYFDNKNPYAQIDARDYFYAREKEMTFPRLWPEKYTCIDLALMYYSDPIAFKSEIMNDATHIGEKCFFSIKTETPEEIESHTFEKTMMCVDCAVGTSKSNDFTAICVGSKDINGYRYIRKGVLLKVEFDEYIAKVIELLKQYKDITHIFIEKNTFNGSDVKRLQEIIRNDKELSHRNITFINEYQKKNKENKIRAIAGKVNNGFIIFNKEDEEFYNQILDYQGEGIGHDDAADCVSELDFRIDDIQVIQKIELFDRKLLGL